MKKKVLAAAACCCFASLAHAQSSSVTLYGIIDDGFSYNSNMGGSRSYAMQSGAEQGDRFGFRGVEDLGGGLSTVFVLENGVDANNGKLSQGGLLFGRQAFVGISSSYGSIKLGRQYDVACDFVGPLEAGNQWGGTVSAHPGDLDNLDGTFRTDSAIKITTASYHGLVFGGTYGLGGVAGDVTRNQAWSIGAGYTQGPLVMGIALKNARNPNVGFFGNSTSGTATAAAANQTSPVFSGFLSAHTYQTLSAAAAYNFGAATVGLVYSNVAFQGLGDLSSGPNPSGYTGNMHFNTAEANFKYQVTPALVAGIAYDYTNSSRIASAHGTNNGATYNEVMAALDYSLSKRTDVYFLVVYQKASGTDSRNLDAIAAISNQTSPSSNGRQALVHVGMRHKF